MWGCCGQGQVAVGANDYSRLWREVDGKDEEFASERTIKLRLI
jgi:hypothetical protein